MRALSINEIAVWIGISDFGKERDWLWVNGEVVISAAVMWARGQPDNHGGNEHCGVIRTPYGYGTND